MRRATDIMLSAILTEVRETNEGDTTTVNAPCVAVIPGVLNKHLLPTGVLAESVDDWIGIPITLRHPPDELAGDPVKQDSWCQEEANKLGEIVKAEIREDDGALVVEMALSVTATATGEAADVINGVRRSEVSEVSTGYRAMMSEQTGTVNGFEFDHVAHSIKPWHLAILPDETGACSVKRGCGTPRVNAQDEGMKDKQTEGDVTNELTLMDRSRLVVHAIFDTYGQNSYPEDIKVYENEAWYVIDTQQFRVDFSINSEGDAPVAVLGEPQSGELQFVANGEGWTDRMKRAIFGGPQVVKATATNASAEKENNMDRTESMALLKKRHGLTDEQVENLAEVSDCTLAAMTNTEAEPTPAPAAPTPVPTPEPKQETVADAPVITEEMMAAASPRFAQFLTAQNAEQDAILKAADIDPQTLIGLSPEARESVVNAVKAKAAANYGMQGVPTGAVDAVNSKLGSGPVEVDINKLPRCTGWNPGDKKSA